MRKNEWKILKLLLKILLRILRKNYEKQFRDALRRLLNEGTWRKIVRDTCKMITTAIIYGIVGFFLGAYVGFHAGWNQAAEELVQIKDLLECVKKRQLD